MQDTKGDSLCPFVEHFTKPEAGQWLFAETRSGMRNTLSGLTRYIGKSMVAKHHFFSWIPSDVTPANLLILIAREDDYFMGVLHSKIHQTWALKQGTSLEDRPRYTPTTTFETFPFPFPPAQEPKDNPRVIAIGQAAKELVEQRDRWLNAAPSVLSDTSPKSKNDNEGVGRMRRYRPRIKITNTRM